MILAKGRRPALLSVPLAGGRSAIYGGGPFYRGGQAVMDTVRSSGFTTVVLWTIHVETNGDLVFNDIPVVRNGQYIGDPAWPTRLRTLKQAPTSVNRIEIGVGSWGVPDWERIHTIINSQGTGPSSILYRNFQALLTATGADAINDDDESHYDVGSTTSFARMTLSMGYRFFTLAPYTNSGFWRGVRNPLGAAVDRVYLQIYAGGAGNSRQPGTAPWATTNGSQVILWPCHGGQGQVFQHRADGSLFNPRSGKCVEIPNSNLTNGTRVIIWTCDARPKQTWTFG
jgi:hypothetical protein